jgi:acylphosphatase
MVVSGQVQGVYYRMFARREANSLGLCGCVRNRLDGGVEVSAEGDRVGLEALIERLRKGPPGAMVEEVAVDWGDYAHEYDDFRIEYT